MKMTYSSGPNTEPYGIPLEAFVQVDDAPSTVTHCTLQVKNVLIQCNKWPFNPTFSSFLSNLSCATESQTFEKSV